jgi:hypothetical protein
MIRASLLKGSVQEQANVRSMLLLFALVPEDTHCPLEVMLLMFNAVHQGSTATMMHIRKWLRILINRSLVLGTIDRPSVHDLVLDWTVAQHTKIDLQDSHRAVVETFRQSRPADFHGRRRFDKTTYVSDPVVSYVVNEIHHHIEKACILGAQHERIALDWLGDMPQDQIVVQTAVVLGIDRLTESATRAESAGDFWMASRCWGAMAELHKAVQGTLDPATTECRVKCLDSIAPLLSGSSYVQSALSPSQQDLEDLHLVQVAALAAGYDFSQTLAKRQGEVQRLLATDAAIRDPVRASLIRLGGLGLFAEVMKCNFAEVGRLQLSFSSGLTSAAHSDGDPAMRHSALMLAFNAGQMSEAVWANPDGFSWDAAYGEGGAWLTEAANEYSYDKCHTILNAAVSGDMIMVTPVLSAPLALHYGDLPQALENFDKTVPAVHRILAEPNLVAEFINKAMFAMSVPTYAYITELDRNEAVLGMLEAAEFTWSTTDAAIERDLATAPYIRPFGDSTKNVHFMSAEHLSLMVKSGCLLMTKQSVSAEAFTSDLPSLDDAIKGLVQCDGGCNLHSTHGPGLNAFVSVACVHEKLGNPEEALVWATAGMSTDLKKAGTRLPVSRVLLQSIQGRALAALGRNTEAGIALEAAAAEAHRFGLWLYEAFALRDLKLLVLDQMSRSESDHGSRRLGAVLRLLKGPADALTPLLKGLKADDLMALPPPDASYKVVYPQSSDEAHGGLRVELQAMKLSALKKQAKAEGVSSEALDETDDADDIKAAVIELLVALHKDAPSLSSLADGETGVVDHLRNGNASQREQAYTELEAAVKRSDVPLLCSCAAVMFEVMCMGASAVDAVEQQRVGLLLCSMVSVDAVAVGACCYKDDVWVTPYVASDSTLGVLLAKPVAELTETDALTLACQFSWQSPTNAKGFTAVLGPAGVDEAHFLPELFFGHQPTGHVIGTDERNSRFSTLLMAMLRQKKVTDPLAVAGVWYLLMCCNFGHPITCKHQLDLGIIELALAELRTGSSMDWVSVSRDPIGRFGSVWFAAQAASIPSPLMPMAEITSKALESGLFQASLSVFKAAEVHGDVQDMNVTTVVSGGVWMLINSDCFSAEAQRLAREAASSLRFILELEQPLAWLAEQAMDTSAQLSCACAMFFGRDESGGPFALTQAHLDVALSFTKEALHPASWGGVVSLKPEWTSRPMRNLAVSDTNKEQLLRNPAWVPHLVDGLLLDAEHPRNQADQVTGPTDGAVKVQRDYAEALSQVSVYAPGRDAVLKDPSVVKSLELLVVQAETDEARDCARATLLALGVTKPAAAPQQSPSGGSDKPSPPHIMASYNWDHQDVILRVVASLQDRGYLVWVDTEQMKGATVDTMALAVEGSELMLIGMSRAYKESSNCRMEAQYALQKKKPLIPLKLVEGYEADGWLGLLLGTSMWYGFYGDTLTAGDSAFDSRMESLCREIGSRGHVDKVPSVAARNASLHPEPEPEPELAAAGDGGDDSGSVAAAAELRTLRVMALHARAVSEGIDTTTIEDAMDSGEPKEKLVTLILRTIRSRSSVAASKEEQPPTEPNQPLGHDHSAMRAEYEGLRMMTLHARAAAEGVDATAIDDAMEASKPKAALVELLLTHHVAVALADQAGHQRELEAFKVTELYRRAMACAGIEEVEIETAMETSRPKAALVALLLERERV